MSSYSVGVNAVAAGGSAASGPLATLVAPATSKVCVREIGSVLYTTNVNTVWAVGRPAVNGITPREQFPFLPQQDPNGPAALSICVVDWVTPPTVPAQFLRRQGYATTLTNVGVLWTFPRGLGVPAGGQLCLWNIYGAANTGLISHNSWMEIDE